MDAVALTRQCFGFRLRLIVEFTWPPGPKR